MGGWKINFCANNVFLVNLRQKNILSASLYNPFITFFCVQFFFYFRLVRSCTEMFSFYIFTHLEEFAINPLVKRSASVTLFSLIRYCYYHYHLPLLNSYCPSPDVIYLYSLSPSATLLSLPSASATIATIAIIKPSLPSLLPI